MVYGQIAKKQDFAPNGTCIENAHAGKFRFLRLTIYTTSEIRVWFHMSQKNSKEHRIVIPEQCEVKKITI